MIKCKNWPKKTLLKNNLNSNCKHSNERTKVLPVLTSLLSVDETWGEKSGNSATMKKKNAAI